MTNPRFFSLTLTQYTLNKSENATLLLLVKMAEKRCFLFQIHFCKIKSLTSSYHLRCTCAMSK